MSTASVEVSARRRPLLALAWGGLAVVLALGLFLGSRPRPAPADLDARVRSVAAGIRCPSCSDLTAAQSNADTAVAVRALIRQQLEAGRTPAQIDAYLEAHYGPDILLRPPAHGAGLLVWLLPPLGAGAALTAVILALRRWRPSPSVRP